MELLTQNMAQSLLVAGLLVLVVEVFVLGFSTFFLFFLGLGLVGTGLIFFTGLVADTGTNAIIIVAIISSVSTAVLWQPLKKMQNKVDHKPVKGDMIGYRFELQQALAEKTSIDHQYSGINWKVSSDQALAAGDEVEVTEIGVGKMKVKRVDA
ncbi:activity regulator of membrane protease YbbK ['Osedax' symbiont bacterium Rs2_46_30_T18]|nr:activity regulator of membrane protease YbbK ['Osedax' symbiont bacterium Rs2_46_30_T18]